MIAVLALLVALLLPALGRARESAKRVHCSSNLRQVSLGLNLYAHDWSRSFPLLHNASTGPFDYGWAVSLFPYVGVRDVVFPRNGMFTCPSVTYILMDPSNPTGPWTPTFDHQFSLTYAINNWLCTPRDPTVLYAGYAQGGLKRADSGDPASGATPANIFVSTEEFLHNLFSELNVGQDPYSFGHFAGGGINMLLLDGHVAFVKRPGDRLKFKMGPGIHVATGSTTYWNVPSPLAGW